MYKNCENFPQLNFNAKSEFGLYLTANLGSIKSLSYLLYFEILNPGFIYNEGSICHVPVTYPDSIFGVDSIFVVWLPVKYSS